ncbi:2,3-dimethylmalate lyase [Daldinia childiae]|uniref:2,3-dimethylmalate lyase n=1 Tax=Daldinia childiae TaxID=326645 RepID=UPI001445E864|nr:2,3-dimethylmalate lyase [Daldinia childiae]KAF3064320.1 2,3-dimethylmalate lyase [Daldinia childiae]
MSPSAITSADYTSGLENESTITLQAATEISSSQFYDSIKPLPLVHTVEIFEDDPITVPSVEEVTVVASSEDDTVDKVDGPLRLSDIVTSVREPTSGAKKLRKMIFETGELIVCPGVYDGLSARTAMELGFNAMYMTGAGTTASRIGQPDLAIAQLHEMRENAEMIANLDPFGPPLIADMDTGYGGPIMVARTVEQYIRAGVAGAHLEDQVLTKRCGHLSGKKVVPQEEYISRIRAAHAARVRLQSDFVLIARTDALQSLGYDACISRLRAARDEGADVGLLEGFTSKEQAAQAVRDLAPWPLLLNSVENGKSPVITVEEAHKMGFRIMIFSFATLAPAYVAIRETLLRLKGEGVVGTPKHITPVKLFEVCGLQHSMAVDMDAGGTSFMGGL